MHDFFANMELFLLTLTLECTIWGSVFLIGINLAVCQGRRQDFQKGGSALSIESPQRGSGAVYTCKHVYSYKFIRNSE